jgi:hypothetical protein
MAGKWVFIDRRQAEELAVKLASKLKAHGWLRIYAPYIKVDETGRMRMFGRVAASYSAHGYHGMPCILMGEPCTADVIVHEFAHHLHHEEILQYHEYYDEGGNLIPKPRKPGEHDHNREFFHYLLRCIKVSGINEYDWSSECTSIQKRAIKAGLYKEPTWEEVDAEWEKLMAEE